MLRSECFDGPFNRDTPGRWVRDLGRGCFDLGRAVPGLGRFPDRSNGLRFVPVRLAGLLTAELAAQRSANVDQAGALLPAAPSFLKLPGTGVFRVLSFTLCAMPSIQGKCHVVPSQSIHTLARYCTLKSCSVCKLLILNWRRGRDSNPRYSFPYTRFPSVRLQPLGHLSNLVRKAPWDASPQGSCERVHLPV